MTDEARKLVKQAMSLLAKADTLLGGDRAKKGGTARAASLTPERRREIARKAAAARWGKGAKEKGKS